MLKTFIDPAEIDTPWEPQPIAWRDSLASDRNFMLRSLVNQNTTHIVREVLVRSKNHRSLVMPTQIQIEDAIADAEAEFSILKACGINVADTQWHIFIDPFELPSALARVAVIDGYQLKGAHLAVDLQEQPELEAPYDKHFAELRDAIFEYAYGRSSGEYLCDISHPRQYLHGVPREAALGNASATYLIDIEPIFWLAAD